jgi:hypothetical protein
MALGEIAGAIRDQWVKDDSDVKLIEATNFVISQLSLNQIIQPIQIREASGPHQYDREYWVLTDLGKKVLNSIQGCDLT